MKQKEKFKSAVSPGQTRMRVNETWQSHCLRDILQALDQLTNKGLMSVPTMFDSDRVQYIEISGTVY